MSEHRYRMLIHYDGEKACFVAQAPELSQCQAEGDTAEAALAALDEEITAQVANIQEAGGRPPIPVDVEEVSGEVAAKISKSLHRELKWLAALEELSEEQLASEMLQSALGRRLQERPRQRRQPGPPRADVNGNVAGPGQPPRDDRQGGRDRGGRRGGGGARYHQIMEDKASFLEYVRGLEQGGGAHPRGRKRR